MYLRNSWYAAGWGSELDERNGDGKPVGRVLLDQPVVMFRDDQGAPVALVDRCPHRFAPLSWGKLVDGVIECPYHGLRFGAEGTCVHNPHGPLPKAAEVHSYPLVERYGVLWIWMGDSDKADDALIPDFSVIADRENYAVVSGHLQLSANYLLAVDNLLDLSHAQFLHPLIGNYDSSDRNRFSMKQDGSTVWAYNHTPGEPVTPLWKMMWPYQEAAGDKRANIRWDPPSNLLLEVGFAPCGRPVSEGPSMFSAHLLTPETDRTAHYFWAAARDSVRDNSEIGEKIRMGIDNTFRTEDEPMVAACQDRMGTTDLMALNPIFLRTDAAAGRARQVLNKLIAQEQAAMAAE